MKKTISIITLFFGVLFTSYAIADHAEHPDPVYTQNAPMICSSPEKIQAYTDHMELEPKSIALGRTGMESHGEPVYMLTIYVKKDGTEILGTIDVPSGAERCILFHSFDLTHTQ